MNLANCAVIKFIMITIGFVFIRLLKLSNHIYMQPSLLK